ncbi:cytochrome c-type biogenesis protein [Phenylobacterium sp.]|uniref:cytochrome c-type biogenesis protein n=1 Tax=Phenylobacterium sp. TaxID=1871053 RepID=UPI0025FAEBD9|nr:cytochrome c-type biogenesis protein [Phenylobacterium sp.]
MRRFLSLALAFALVAGPAAAVNPDEQLPDPALEARAHKLSKELRCVVCQNQSIDDSDAALARDLRIILRERISAGDTDAQAVDYLVARYGSFVQLKPPMRLDTLALWFGPLAVLLVGGIGAVVYMRGRSPAKAGALTAEEEAELAEMLDSDEVR